MSEPTDVIGGRAARGGTGLAVLLIIAATLAAYYNSFSAPFVFDDIEAIVNNPAIRRLQPLSAVMFGGQDAGMTGNGRPVLNASLALNYAVGGSEVRGYHAVNVLIHALGGLALFGLVRRTLRATRWGEAADTVALLAALLWAVHPLQTEAVTYIVQRAESLAGLFGLLTLYLFVRGTSVPRRWGWFGGSVLACLLGMGTKEVMAVAPLLVLLYDRTFVAGSFRAAWVSRRAYYGILAATWLPLVWLVAGTGGRGDSAGFQAGVSGWHYLLTQCAAIMHYLRLVVWPHPLVLDYGTGVVQSPAEVWWQGLVVVALLGGTLWALVRRPALGFLGAWFFLTLAPSSSFVPVVTQTMAEHRMYLAVAAPLVLVALGLHAALGRRGRWVGLAAVAALLAATVQRNADYRSALILWADTVAHRPDNPRAQNNLAIELSTAGRSEEAVAHFQESLRLEPGRADARNNLANELLKQGRTAEAITQYEQVLTTKPDDVLALGNLGVALLQAGRLPEALACYEKLLAIDPTDVSAQGNAGFILLQTGRAADAVPHYARAAQLQPGEATAQFNLAVALTRAGRAAEALIACEEALRLDPGLTTARQLAEQLRAALPPGRQKGP